MMEVLHHKGLFINDIMLLSNVISIFDIVPVSVLSGGLYQGFPYRFSGGAGIRGGMGGDKSP